MWLQNMHQGEPVLSSEGSFHQTLCLKAKTEQEGINNISFLS